MGQERFGRWKVAQVPLQAITLIVLEIMDLFLRGRKDTGVTNKVVIKGGCSTFSLSNDEKAWATEILKVVGMFLKLNLNTSSATCLFDTTTNVYQLLVEIAKFIFVRSFTFL